MPTSPRKDTQSITDIFLAVAADRPDLHSFPTRRSSDLDVPVIGGVHVGSVTEDVAVVSNRISTSGALTIADVDQGQSNFAPQTSAAGTYGTFKLGRAHI